MEIFKDNNDWNEKTVVGFIAFAIMCVIIQEALAWGSQYGITTYHTHVIAGEVTYMAGQTHDEVTSAIRSGSGPDSSGY